MLITSSVRRSGAVVAVIALALACGRDRPPQRTTAAPPEPPVASAPTPPAPPPGCKLPALPTRYPAAPRVVAIGDLHGDAAAARRALRLAGAVDARDRWIGGKLVLVQVGDILDRGDDEQEIMDLFESLRVQAERAGGAVHVLNGNHETMNARGDYRYVTPGGFADFNDAPGVAARVAKTKALASVPEAQRARVAAFSPGGPYAKILASHNTAVIIGDTAFVHGGILPRYARYGLDKLNREARCWLAGESPAPTWLRDDDNPLWSRHYAFEPPACKQLDEALALLSVKRMVIAHTPQRHINSACDNKVWRIDTGMAKHYGGATQVLELTPAGPKPL